MYLVSTRRGRERWRIGKGPVTRGSSTRLTVSVCNAAEKTTGTSASDFIFGSRAGLTTSTNTILGYRTPGLTISNSVGIRSTIGARCAHTILSEVGYTSHSINSLASSGLVRSTGTASSTSTSSTIFTESVGCRRTIGLLVFSSWATVRTTV